MSLYAPGIKAFGINVGAHRRRDLARQGRGLPGHHDPDRSGLTRGIYRDPAAAWQRFGGQKHQVGEDLAPEAVDRFGWDAAGPIELERSVPEYCGDQPAQRIAPQRALARLIDSDTNAVVFVWHGGEVEELPSLPKSEVAAQLLDRVEKLRRRA